ncbi:MAG: hypothetical protein WAL70_02800 [Aeromicrobium sp.]
MRRVLGLPVIVTSTLLVLAVGAREAWSGLATVADIGTGITAALLLVMLVALVVRFTGDRSSPRRLNVLSVLGGVSVVLAALMLVATFRGHTASGRFADRMDTFPLPDAYEKASPAGAEVRNQTLPEHVVRVWRVPTGDDACAAMTSAFRAWAEPPFEEYTRGGSCTISSDEQTDKAEAHVSPDGSAITLEMWLEGAD